MAPPRRTADGFPLQRLQLICAVIEKRLQLPLWNKDVYVNVVGGLRVSEPSADLAVAMSVISSALEEPIRPMTAFIGEVGEQSMFYFIDCCSMSSILTYRPVFNSLCAMKAWAESSGLASAWRSASARRRRWASGASSCRAAWGGRVYLLVVGMQVWVEKAWWNARTCWTSWRPRL